MDFKPTAHVIHFFLRKKDLEIEMFDEEDKHDWNFVPYVRRNTNHPLNIHHSFQPHTIANHSLKCLFNGNN